MITVNVGGTWLHELGPVGDVKWSWSLPIGCKEASWRLALPRGYSHPVLRRGQIVTIYDAGLPVWSGVLIEPNVLDWSFTALGVGALFDRVAAVKLVSTTYSASSDPQAVALAAIVRGWPFTVDTTTGGVPTGQLSAASDTANNLNTLSALLNEYTRRSGRRWIVDEYRRLTTLALPTVESWSLHGVPGFQTVDDDYASLRFGRYVSTVGGTPPAPTAWGMVVAGLTTSGSPLNDDALRWGPREALDDLTSAGALASGAAQTIENTILDDNRARPAYSSPVEVSADQVTTPTGTPARLTMLRPGEMVQHYGVYDVDGRGGVGDVLKWTIGETAYDSTQPDRITLSQVGLAERTVHDFAAATAVDESEAFQ